MFNAGRRETIILIDLQMKQDGASLIISYYKPALQGTMIVSENQIQQQSKMVYMIKDKNLVFLQLIDRNALERQHVSQKRFAYYIQLLEKMDELDFDQIIQWTSIFYNKRTQLIRQMLIVRPGGTMSQSELKVFSAFRLSVRLLVKVCNIFEIQYDESLVQTMLKKFYYSEYGDRVVHYFISADYDCQFYWPLPPRRKPIPMDCCQNKETTGQSP